MHRSIRGARWSIPRKTVFLVVLVATGVGVCRLVTPQGLEPGVKELARVTTPDSAGPMVKESVRPMGVRQNAGPLAFSPEGKALALPKKADGRLELLSLVSGEVQVVASSVNHRGGANRMVFSDDGRFLAGNFIHAGVTVWDLSSGSEQAQIPVTRPSWVFDMAFAKGGRTLITLITSTLMTDPKGDLRTDYAVRWDAMTGKKQGT
jgi:WD40 repeat protein